MGSRRQVCAAVLAMVALGCGQKKDGEPDANPFQDASCTNLGCFIVDCAAKGLPPTTITGTVYAPNGTLPLFGVNVYVPSSDPGPLVAGVTCDRCSTGLQGGSLVSTTTDEAGNFRLENVPATSGVPIVVQTGKWRRQFTLPAVAACQDTLADKATTTLPKTKAEGDIPAIALTTGGADAIECLLRKLGIDDSEFGTAGDDKRVHLYFGNGANQFRAGFPGGTGLFAPAKAMWDSVTNLSEYDIVMLSCEGNQLIDAAFGASVGVNDKPQSSLQALHDYAGLGGRVFMSHWHNVWIGGDRRVPAPDPNYGMADWKTIGNWNFPDPQDQENTTAVIDLAVPKGMSFATWMMNVGGSPTGLGQIPIVGARYTLPTINSGDRRVYVDPTTPNNPKAKSSVQDLQFTTPVDLPEDQRCGKVVFSDMHVSAGPVATRSTSTPGVAFPGTGINNDAQKGCDLGDLLEQEKALAFIFFDISTCVGVLQ
jgi:hypothetical protein